MIFPEKLLYAEIEVEKDKVEDVIFRLGKWGFFHPDTSKESSLHFFKYENLFSQIKSISDFLNVSLNQPYREVKVEALKDKFSNLYRRVLNLKEELAQLNREKELIKLADMINRAFEGKVSQLVESLRVIPFKVGTLKKEVLNSLIIYLKTEKLYGIFSPLYQGDTAVLVFSPPDKEHLFGKIESSFNVAFVPSKYFKREIKEEVNLRENRIREKIEKLKKQYEKELASIYTFLKVKREISKLISSSTERNGKRVLKGWIPEKKKEEFLDLLKDCKVRFLQSEKIPPTLIRTPKFLKPIEEIVFSYSYPSYYDINPVLPFVAVFILLFGIMFGDIGHGLLLSTVALLLEKKGKKALGRLMFLSGISSVVFGALYGSAFGKEILHPILFSPMESVESLLIFSIGVGVLVISVGFLIRFFSSIHRENLEQLLFDEEGIIPFATYWLSLGILIKALILKMDVKLELLILTVLLLTSFIYTVRKTKKFATSLVDTLRVFIENLINTLSFMRLGAFALAHGALFFAIFTIADSVKSCKGGNFIYWLIVILGNLVIVALEGLIVTIQALRLNYYEFFKKFYRGGGRPFKPFKLEVS